MQDLFSPQQLDFEFELMDVYNSNLIANQSSVPNRVKNSKSIAEQIDLGKLLEVLNELTRKYSENRRTFLNNDSAMEHFQKKYINKIEDWDKNAMKVIQHYGLSAVLNELSVSD